MDDNDDVAKWCSGQYGRGGGTVVVVNVVVVVVIVVQYSVAVAVAFTGAKDAPRTYTDGMQLRY